MGGSAIAKLNQVYGIQRQDWILLSRDIEKMVWKNRVGVEELEQYQFVVNDSSEFKTEREVFEMRYRSQNLVSSKYLEVDQTNNLCSTLIKGSIFIQRIPIRLSNINQIPYPEILHFYSQCFKGFSELFSRYGYFQISEDLICFNQAGKVKVWMNSTLDAVYPETNYLKPEGTQTEMLEKLMQLLDLNTNQVEQSQSLYLFISKRKPYTFMQAYSILVEYSKQYNIMIPNCSNCVLEMMKVLKANPSALISYNNPFKEKDKILKPNSQVIFEEKNKQFSFASKHTPLVIRPQTAIVERKIHTAPYQVKYSNEPIQIQSQIIKIQERPQRITQIPQRHVVQNITNVRCTSVSPSASLSSPKTLGLRNPPQFIQSIQPVRKLTPPRANSNSINSTPKRILAHHNSGSKQIKRPSPPKYKPNFNIVSHHLPHQKMQPIVRKSPQKQRNIVINNDYYTSPSQMTANKYNTNSLMNKVNVKSAHKLPEKTIKNISEQKDSRMTPIKYIPIQKINRFPEESMSKKFNSITIEAPKQPIIFVNPKQNSSYVVLPETQTVPHIKIYSKQSPQMFQNEYYNTYEDEQPTRQPLFPPPQIVNVRREQQDVVQNQQPRGSIYIKRKQPSIEYIHDISSNNYASMQDVRVSNEIHKIISQQRQALAETAFQYQSKYDYERDMQSPVEYRVTREQSTSVYKEQPETYPNLYSYFQNQIYTETTSEPGIKIGNQYMSKMDSEVRSDFMETKIGFNGQPIDQSQKYFIQ